MRGKVLKYIRNSLGLSQSELAEKLGVSLPTIYRYEAGTQKPQPKNARHLEQLLGFTQEDVMRIEELLRNEENEQLKAKLRAQANV
jgi:transcriptional regulator with XRE-family HTH domain